MQINEICVNQQVFSLQHSLELDMPEEKRIRLGDFEFPICTRKDEDQESVYSWQSYETGKTEQKTIAWNT